LYVICRELFFVGGNSGSASLPSEYIISTDKIRNKRKLLKLPVTLESSKVTEYIMPGGKYCSQSTLHKLILISFIYASFVHKLQKVSVTP
jgi:hypothetical protein